MNSGFKERIKQEISISSVVLNVVSVSETVPICFLYSWKHKAHKIVWSYSMQDFIKRYKPVFVPSVLERLTAKVRINFINVTVFCCSCYYSPCLDMNCVQLLCSSRGAVVPHYVTVFKKGTNKGDLHFFSRDFPLTLNFRTRRRFKRKQGFSEIFRTWSSQLHVFESVSPKCLCIEDSCIIVLFEKRGGWYTEFYFLESVIAMIFAWIWTSQSTAQSDIVGRSSFRILAAWSRHSTMIYRLMSFANRRVENPGPLMISLI